MLGRPGCWLPVWMKVIAGSWLMASVYTDLTMRDVVDDLARVCGSSSLSQVPILAVLLELEDRARRPGSELWPEVMPVMRWPRRIGVGQLGAVHFFRCGL